MRDSTKPCQHTLSNEVEYKEVVVIGNGPSGLVTSFMLAGNVPYLKQIPEDLPIDEMLKARLSNLPVGQNLYDTDLLELAEGLEGRSQNPVPLLMDNLLRPCADLGIQADPLIEWKYDVEKQIEHIVLGRGPPGGAWHGFPAAVRTLSPCAWLTLPPHTSAPNDRLPASALADYYRRYVRATKLKRYFRSGVVVTSVRPAPRAPAPPCARGCPRAAAYCVAGFDKSEGRPFRYLCRRVVLACGAGDRPNTLEPNIAKHSLHSLADLQSALQNLEANAPPVLVVGSGVSGADAVCLAARAARAVRHLHRTPALALARLEPGSYPDYCQVYKMMCDGEKGNYPNYTSYPNHVIVDVTPEETPPPSDPRKDPTTRPKRVKLLNIATNELTEIIVSIITVLIGSKPDLFFLQTNFNLNCIELDSECIKCTDKKKIEDTRQWFLKDHWHYLKTVLGQSIQSCKSRLNSTEINGNTNTKCVLPDCNKRSEKKCTCNNLISKLENGVIKTSVEKDKCVCDNLEKIKCRCSTNSYTNGVGFGIDPKQPVDGRNPIAIDKSTHELLNAPKGMYALGPLTADNFVRFIPGGALAIVAHIHKEKTAE